MNKVTGGEYLALRKKLGASEDDFNDAWNYWYVGPGSKQEKHGKPEAENKQRSTKGSGNADDWKKQLKSMADKGDIPRSVTGSPEQQAEVMKEVNNLYQKPDIDHTFYDQGDGAYIMWKDGSDVTSRVSYPSGKDASQEEKDGVVKWMMINHQKKYGKPEAEKARERMVERGKEEKPRPRTRGELMVDNKKKYEEVQKEIAGMKPGIKRDVKEKVILPWIKGENWMGGLSDRKFEQIAKKMPYSFDEIYDEFNEQMKKY